LEQSYMCSEQVGQMQASYDSLVMLKIVHDAGGDLVTDPINFYCYEWGSQNSLFYQCLDRIFGKCETSYSANDQYDDVNEIRIPLPLLSEFFALVPKKEAKKIIGNLHKKLSHSCDHFEMEMKGTICDSFMKVTLMGSYGVLSPFLKPLVAVRNELLSIVYEHRNRIISRLRNLVMLKMVQDRLGTTIAVKMGAHNNVVFTRLLAHCNFDLALDENDVFSYESMLLMLKQVLSQVVINKTGEGEAA
jgi:hypothetical protein